MNECVCLLISIGHFFFSKYNKIIFKMAEVLKIKFLFRMLADSTFVTEAREDVYLNIEVDLETDREEDQNDAEVVPKS